MERYPFNPFQPEVPVGNVEGNLPHWRQDGTTYFVTFHTADSLPQAMLDELNRERHAWLKLHPQPLPAEDLAEYHARFTRKIERWLDLGHGACVLGRPELKRILENALRYFDGERYQLGEHIVMPNHVHALVSPLGDHELSDILQSWKSFTGLRINQALSDEGQFWQKEYFDHLVRSAGSLETFAKYIRLNPQKWGGGRRK